MTKERFVVTSVQILEFRSTNFKAKKNRVLLHALTDVLNLLVLVATDENLMRNQIKGLKK